MIDEFLLFFDTLSIDEQGKDQFNSIRFFNIAVISEIRIVPFGSVVECNLSDEAVIGTTNPAMFNIKFYGYNDSSTATLFQISEYDYNESNGICRIPLAQPVSTNILLLRGSYSTITVAVFGVPYFSPLQQSGIAVPNFSVPPPPLVSTGPNFPVLSVLGSTGNTQASSPQITHISGNKSGILPTADKLHVLNVTDKIDAPNASSMSKEASANVSNTVLHTIEDSENGDKDFDAVSSNDDLSFDNEEADFNLIKNIRLLDPNDPLLKPCHWRFDPLTLVHFPDESLPSATKRKRLTDPTLTLFEIHKWLLSTEQPDACGEDKKNEDSIYDSLLMPPSPDRTTSEQDANRLLKAFDAFGITIDKFATEWLDTVEDIIPTLPSGLAYLSLYQPKAFEFATSCLLVWAHAGLQLDSAVLQPDSVDILRHLRVGIELVGVLLSTTCAALTTRLLHFTPASNAANISEFGFHAQHMLMDLLESPLISTPLRLHIASALERSLSAGVIGLRAFVGLESKEDLESIFEGNENVEQMPTPYHRIVVFLTTNKSVPVALACNRLLARVHFYDGVLQFDEFMKRLIASTVGKASSLEEEVENEYALQKHLATISQAIADPESILAPLPKDAPKLKSLRSTCDSYRVIYRLLDSIHLFDHLIWLLEQSPRQKIGLTVATEAVGQVLAALLSNPTGPLFLVAAPVLAGRILRIYLRHQRRADRRLGLEMAVKLEALGCIDALIAITRRKGETGCHHYITEALALEAANDKNWSKADPLYAALFALARLFLTPTFAPWAAEMVVAGNGDFFVPCLMLLEAVCRHSSSAASTTKTKGQGEAEIQIKDEAEEEEEEPKRQDSTENRRSRETLLSRMGFSDDHIEVATLLSIITVGVLRHASDAQYLERFGPRLLLIVQPTSWEDRLSSLCPSELFSHQRTFSEAGAPWLYWLREAPSPTLVTSPFELFSWYADQLSPLVEVCEESLTTPPPSLLLLLRLLRSAFTSGTDADLAVIELYTRDGLVTLSTLVDCTAYHLLLHQPNARRYRRGSVESLIADMMSEGVAILSHLTTALVDAVGEDFRDITPVKAVCRAYAAASVMHDQLGDKIRRDVLRCISNYALASQDVDALEGVDKDLWSSVCREIFSLTVSSPFFFLPGLQLLLDLLPLPLPVQTLKSLSRSEHQAVTATRDWWCHRLTHDLAVEMCGLVEVFSASPLQTPLHRRLNAFVDRVTSLGSSAVAQMFAGSALDTLIEVYQAANAEISGTGCTTDDVQHEETSDPATTTTAASMGTSCAVDLNLPLALKTLTPGSKLVLGAQQPPTLPDQTVALLQPPPPTSPPLTTAATVNEDFAAFSSIADVSSILHALSFLHFTLHHPTCKQALLEILRKDVSSSSSSRCSRGHRLLFIFSSILEGVFSPESRYQHEEVLTLLINCIGCLFDTSIGLKGSPDVLDPLFDLANHLPPTEWLSNLVDCLLIHLHQSPRIFMPSTAQILRILHQLSLHDFGFAIIQRHLCQKQHSRVLASLLQGLIDRFSTEYNATLGALLLFVSALLANPSYAEEASRFSSSVECGVGLANRQLRLSTSQLKQLLGWSDNLMKELTYKLDKTASNTEIGSSAFILLHDGMKSLLHWLVGARNVDTALESFQPVSIPILPTPLALIKLYHYHHQTVEQPVNDASHLAAARLSLHKALLPPPRSAFLYSPHHQSHIINLLEYASHVCPGVDLKAEVAALGSTRRRRRDLEDAEATLQHKRRRKGQASDIIHTGRSTKKYVAPMRGRGFTIRQATQSSGGSGNGSGGSGSVGGVGISGAGGGGSSLLGAGVSGGGVSGLPDVFRSRPQNTSRPPSLHVDDFNKLEKDDCNVIIGSCPEPSSYSREVGALRGVREGGSFRGGRSGGMVGSQRVLSTLPFAKVPPVSSGTLPLPSPSVAPLQSWSKIQPLSHSHLLTLTNPTVPSRSKSKNMALPRID